MLFIAKIDEEMKQGDTVTVIMKNKAVIRLKFLFKNIEKRKEEKERNFCEEKNLTRILSEKQF